MIAVVVATSQHQQIAALWAKLMTVPPHVKWTLHVAGAAPSTAEPEVAAAVVAAARTAAGADPRLRIVELVSSTPWQSAQSLQASVVPTVRNSDVIILPVADELNSFRPEYLVNAAGMPAAGQSHVRLYGRREASPHPTLDPQFDLNRWAAFSSAVFSEISFTAGTTSPVHNVLVQLRMQKAGHITEIVDTPLPAAPADPVDTRETLSRWSVGLGAFRQYVEAWMTRQKVPGAWVGLDPKAVATGFTRISINDWSPSSFSTPTSPAAESWLQSPRSPTFGAVGLDNILHRFPAKTVFHMVAESAQLLRPGGFLLLRMPWFISPEDNDPKSVLSDPYTASMLSPMAWLSWFGVTPAPFGDDAFPTFKDMLRPFRICTVVGQDSKIPSVLVQAWRR